MATQDDSLVKKIWCELQQRVSGFLEFIGFLLYLVFRLRRVWLALGGALAGLGLGLCVNSGHHACAPCLLAAGGGLLGFFAPRASI